MRWITLGRKSISGRTFAAAITLELVLLGFGAWIMAGVPGIRQDEGWPSVTIQFAPFPAPNTIVRIHNI
jgi:hypothetical protein